MGGTLAGGSASAGDFVGSFTAAKSGEGKSAARGGDEDADVRVERLAGGPPADGSARERDAICAEISGGGREREAGIQDGVVKSSDMPPRSSARLTVQESGPQQFLIPAGPPRCIEYDERNRSAGVGGVRGQGSVFENQPLTFRRASSHGIPADRLKVPRTVQVGFPKDQPTKRPPHVSRHSPATHLNACRPRGGYPTPSGDPSWKLLKGSAHRERRLDVYSGGVKRAQKI